MRVRLRKIRAEHLDDLRLYFLSYGAVNGVRSSLGGQLDRLRDGVTGCSSCKDCDSSVINLIEPTGYMARVREVYTHCAPVIDKTPAIAVTHLELALATYPDPSWAKYPSRFLAATATGNAEFLRMAELWKKKGKSGEKLSWTAEEFIQWCLFRSRQRDGKAHRVLVAKMIREATDMYESAFESYETAYRKVYHGLG